MGYESYCPLTGVATSAGLPLVDGVFAIHTRFTVHRQGCPWS